jgi:hypothetical protein
MPFTYVFDAATNIVRTIAQGLIRFDDLAAHLQALIDAGVARVPQLIDARDSHLQAARGFSHRTALVVSTPVDFGMARMYGALARKVDPDFAVFRDLGEAEAWRQGAQ